MTRTRTRMIMELGSELGTTAGISVTDVVLSYSVQKQKNHQTLTIRLNNVKSTAKTVKKGTT